MISEAQKQELRALAYSKNMTAFLDMLAWSEGTVKFGNDDGYNVIVGGTTFSSYKDHPNQLIPLPRLGIKSTAAGRYQLLYRYWKVYRDQLQLKDFGPASQAQVAVQQIRERRAIADIEAGRITKAIERCSNIWASLPGAGYGQHEHKLDNLIARYKQAGGTFVS